MEYRSIFISDLHLGSPACRSDLVCDFLKNNNTQNLYLVGDILDLWSLKRNLHWPENHSNVISLILQHAKSGTNVYYILGNHDKDLRQFLHLNIKISNIQISNQVVHRGLCGGLYLVIHGDQFDKVIQSKTGKFWTWLGSHLYNVLLKANTSINWFRSKLKLKYWSFADFCKRNLKSSLKFMTRFEVEASNFARGKGYDGVICGHIHNCKIKDYAGISYMNSGDWVDCCTAIVETKEGDFKLITWSKP